MASDKQRREVAMRLRQMADTHHAVEASRVTRALGLEYEVYGTVMAFNSAAVQALADLIDRPTCRICATDHEYEDSVRCDRCRMTFRRPWEPFKYCPNCGAEVI
ncbi:MAG: hypothetical protein U0J93_09840 [Parolsenella sp.]|uniref:hypothetical protein n=1 Tax=Parolsenella sp. TaxID=2083006 RepID=UPI002E789F14|nr:hypothetical protein [Parolsenella sp.]MEE1373655.1 hypothetical protein [Parolsenella sp.]